MTSTSEDSSPATEAARIGRPAAITPELEEIILERLAVYSVERVFSDPALPDKATFYNHCKRSPAFFDASARARAHRALVELDEAEKALEVATPDDVPVIRERMQHARWKVSRMLAKFYGDRVEIDARVSGGVLLVPAPVDPDSWAAVAESQQRAIEVQRAALPEAVEPAILTVVEPTEAETERGGVNGFPRK